LWNTTDQSSLPRCKWQAILAFSDNAAQHSMLNILLSSSRSYDIALFSGCV